MNLKDILLITFAALLSVVLVLLICGFLIALMNPGVAHAQTPSNLPRPRFEQMLDEKHGDGSRIVRAVVVHDKETGQEIACIESWDHGAFSCWLTGRSWGGAQQQERPKHVGISPKHALP